MTDDEGKLDLDPLKSGASNADAKRNSNLMKAGIGVGIGSAALVAALLYTSRKKKPESE